MVDLRAQAEKYVSWWNRENGRPLVNSYFPKDLPYGGLDVEIPVEDLEGRALANAEALHHSPVPQDSLIIARVNFGTVLYPAVAGAEAKFEKHTSWAVHTANSIDDVKLLPFDPGHPVYREYRTRLEVLLDQWNWETYLPVPSDYAGPFDILSAFLGPENLMIEMMSNPDAVRKAVDAATQFTIDVIRFEKELFRSAGFREWSPTLFGSWQPGWAGLFVEDFSALVGPHHYRDFMLEPHRRILEEFDTALFHTHSAGYKNNLEMLALPEGVAFEFGNDPGGPDTELRLETARAIMSDGRPLMLGSWSIPLPDEEMNRIVDSLPAQGLDLHFQCTSAEHADVLYRRIKEGQRIKLEQEDT